MAEEPIVQLSEVETDWKKWIPVCDALVLQAYYRVMSFVSIHAPVREVFEAVKHIAETKRGGKVYWVVEGRVARWDNLEVFPGIKMTLWIFGRQRNTVYARRGWWTLYLFDVAVKSLAMITGTYKD